jgi:MoaA/NifB/PqqE/SkfB family radical SAM enzyme
MKKKKCNHCGGKYYSQGELDEEEAKLIKKLALKGVTIYRQYGKPQGCGTPGHPPC